MFAAVVLLVLCQQPFDRTRSAEAVQMTMSAESAVQTASKFQGVRAKREFAERFNHLVSALKDFEAAYSSNHGEVWPVKQAAKLDSAMRQLSTAPGWRAGN